MAKCTPEIFFINCFNQILVVRPKLGARNSVHSFHVYGGDSITSPITAAFPGLYLLAFRVRNWGLKIEPKCYAWDGHTFTDQNIILSCDFYTRESVCWVCVTILMNAYDWWDHCRAKIPSTNPGSCKTPCISFCLILCLLSQLNRNQLLCFP